MSHDEQLLLSASDLERAAEDGIITPQQADELIRWGFQKTFESVSQEKAHRPEERKGFNLVTVAYYFGAFLMMLAGAWFLADKWETLSSPGVFTTTLIYALIAVSVGAWVRRAGYIVGGGLLFTVAVCLVPLLIYTVQDMLGLWPETGSYPDFSPRVHALWIALELATIAAAVLALVWTRFGFLTAPLALSLWLLSMDSASLILQDSLREGQVMNWISVIFGALAIIAGYFLDKFVTKPGRSDDFGYWCYLFGTLAFWGGLTAMNGDSELKKAVYAVINLGLVGLAIKLKRTVFLVFGALGVHIYLGHLAFTVFEDSFFFPFVVAFLGLSLILVTVLAQRFWLRKADG